SLVLELVAGNLKEPNGPGSGDGIGVAASFDNPSAVAGGGAGNVYVADTGNQTIRKITTGGVVTPPARPPGAKGAGDRTRRARQGAAGRGAGPRPPVRAPSPPPIRAPPPSERSPPPASSPPSPARPFQTPPTGPVPPPASGRRAASRPTAPATSTSPIRATAP